MTNASRIGQEVYDTVRLGGNRHGNTRRYINLLITMVLGGLWHGAGWTFIVWGGLHGLYLVVNHGWRYARAATNLSKVGTGVITRSAAWGLTFTSVVCAWVFFRSPDLATAISMIKGMVGLNGIVTYGLPDVYGLHGLAWLTGLLAIALLAPNLREIMSDRELVLNGNSRSEVPLRYCNQVAYAGRQICFGRLALLLLSLLRSRA